MRGAGDIVDLIHDAEAVEPTGFGHDIGRDDPFAPGQRMGAVAFGQRLGFGALRFGHDRRGEVLHGCDVLGDLVLCRMGTGGPQDQAHAIRVVEDAVGHRQQRVALVVIGDLAADVQSRLAGGDDGIAALEQDAVCHRHGLAVLGVAGDLHQHRLAGTQALGAAQKGRAARWQTQHHPALPLQWPVADAAKDRAGPRCIGCVDQQVVELPVHQQGGGLDPVQIVQDDGTALHAGPPFMG